MPLEHWPYLGVFAVLIAASFGLPIPEDIPLLTGGYLCHIDLASIYVMLVVAFVGVLSGDFILFGLGRKFGHHIVEHHVVRRLVRPSRLLMAEKLFQQHGVKIIFMGRFLPGLRPMIFMAAGVMKVRPVTFVAVNGLAASISVPTLVILGKVFGANIEQLKSGVRTTSEMIVLAVVAVALSAGAIYLYRRQKRMMASTGIQPRIDRETLANMPPSGEVSASEDEEACPTPAHSSATASSAA